MVGRKGIFGSPLEKENLLPYLPDGVKVRQSFSLKPTEAFAAWELLLRIAE